MDKLNKRETILAWLDELGVPYKLIEHEPAYTMEDMERFGLYEEGEICKNLFLRDAKKGKRHFLVVVSGDKPVDLKKLGDAMGQRLSFASEERLQKHLSLRKGEITPLGLYFNTDNSVEVFLDNDLKDKERLGIHPCDNTATLMISFHDLWKIMENVGNEVKFIEI